MLGIEPTGAAGKASALLLPDVSGPRVYFIHPQYTHNEVAEVGWGGVGWREKILYYYFFGIL